jgi:hypothetical protein
MKPSTIYLQHKKTIKLTNQRPHYMYNEMVQGPCAHLRFLMLGHGDCGLSYDKCNVGWLMSTKLEHSRTNSNETNQFVLANLEHSKSNSNKTSQLCNMFWTLTSVTLKSRSNQKPGYYVMYPCTYCVFGFGTLVAKPRIRFDQNLVCELRWPRGKYVQSFKSIAPVVTERTQIRWTLTSVTLKSRSNQKPGYYVMYPY